MGVSAIKSASQSAVLSKPMEVRSEADITLISMLEFGEPGSERSVDGKPAHVASRAPAPLPTCSILGVCMFVSFINIKLKKNASWTL